MDRQAGSPLDLSRTLPAGGGLLVPYSLSGSPVIKQLMQMVLWCLAIVPGWAVSISVLPLTDGEGDDRLGGRRLTCPF